MQLSATYRFFALLLSISFFLGVSLPGGLHAKLLVTCDVTESMHDGHQMNVAMMEGHDDCPMEDQHHSKGNNVSVMEAGMHDFSFTCACSIEEAKVKTEAPVFQRVKLQVLTVVQVFAKNLTNKTESGTHPILIPDSYSPPPIFLVNESFLI